MDLKNKINKLEEEQLRLKKEVTFLRNIFNNSPFSLFVLDTDKKIVSANDSACQLLGLEYNAIKGKQVTDFIHFQSQEDKMIFLKNDYFNEKLYGSIYNEQLVKDITISFLGEVNEGHSLYQLEPAIEQDSVQNKDTCHELIEEIFTKFADGLVVFDRNGIIIKANPTFCKSIGYNADEIEGKVLFSYIKEEDQERFFNLLQGNVETEMNFVDIAFLTKLKKQVFQVSISSYLQNGLYIACFREKQIDIVERINQSEQKFLKVFEGLKDGMIIWSNYEIDYEDEMYLQSNPESLHFTKYKNNGITIFGINRKGFDILNIDSSLPLDEQINQLVFLDGDDSMGFSQYIKNLKDRLDEYQVVKLKVNDEIKSIELYTIPNIFKDLHLSILRDITDRLQMEKNLQQSEMLNVLGELAAGIAHEIRNPMTSLKGFIQLLHNSVSGYSMYFNIIMTELERINSIVNEFLYLAKPQSVNYKKINITQIMKETIDLLSAQAFMKSIRFKTNFPRDDLSILCEPNQIKQVFINIIKNAIEVMTEGGTITIRIREEKNAPYVKISIRDEGSGIPKERIQRLGQPFYTTKEKGTGLGLMISFKIIKEHGGKVEVDSKLGKGTVFHIYLPIKKEDS